MNKPSNATIPTLITIFGGSGDLAYRKLLPALYNLFREGWLPGKFAIIGNGRSEFSDEVYRDKMKEGVKTFSRTGFDDHLWQQFAQHVYYHNGSIFEEDMYKKLDEKLTAFETEWEVSHCQRLFYLSVGPNLVEPIAEQLGKAQICAEIDRSRVVVEKPFGHNLETARDLNQKLLSIFKEDQLYRIDHYLGKEPVQNLLAFRFANSLFEPIWNRNHIDHVEITVGEDIGIGDRGGYYDTSGALRDMVQNHLLQVLTLVAMEAPLNFEAREIRDKKTDVLRAVRKYSPQEVDDYVVRGQYGQGPQINSYREEKDIPHGSSTETFVALQMYLDNWRWHGVPFFLRTGKRMPRKISCIAIQFKSAPFPELRGTGTVPLHPNRLIINIQPEPQINLLFYAKKPGLKMELAPVTMQFEYNEAYEVPTPEAYETLLLDAMVGNAALYMRADQVELAWDLMMPILNHWENTPLKESEIYSPGTWGPKASHTLLHDMGASWYTPL